MNFKSLSKTMNFKNVEYCEMIHFSNNEISFQDEFLDNHIKITLNDDRIIRIFENESECSLVVFYDNEDNEISSVNDDMNKLYIQD